MRPQRWLLPLVVVLAVVVGVTIAGFPKKQADLRLKPLTSTTTTIAPSTAGATPTSR